METKKSYQITTFGNKVLQVDVIPLDEHEIRVIWDAEAQKYYFSIVDIVGVLTEQPNIERASTYWRVLKNRLKKEGNETVTNCNRLKFMHRTRITQTCAFLCLYVFLSDEMK